MLLLVVDTQKLITNSDLYQFDIFKTNVKMLIETARKNGVDIVFVRHDDGVGHELTKGTLGYEIYEDFQPMPNERIFDKTVNSPFKDTGLLAYLNNKEEDTIIVVGLQTEYCIDATIKAGFEHGFKMIVPSNCNTTFDNNFMSAEETYKYYNEFIWSKRYAECISLQDVISLIES